MKYKAVCVRKQVMMTVFLIVFLAFSFSSSASTGAGEELYHRIVDFGNGMQYINAVSVNDRGRQESCFAEITPGSSVIPTVFADDTIYGSMTLGQTINYAEGLGYTFLGGMNSDFFSMKYGVPLGIVVENGQYKSSPEGYNSVCFTADGHAAIQDYTAVQITLANLGGAPSGNNAGEGVALTHFNKYRMNNAGLYLYDEYFSTVSTRTSGSGWYVKFRILEGTMKTKGSMKLQVTEKLRSSYPLDIGEGYMVLTAGDASGMDVNYEKFDPGDIVRLDTHSWDSSIVENAVWATGAGDIIVADGQMTDPSSWDQAIVSANPRSALGIKENGTVVYYTIDGRNQSHSNGLTMKELAEELLSKGCTEAVNLDGGGSTSFSIQFPNQEEPTLQNRPSGGSERSCSTFLLFAVQALSDGLPAHLYLTDLGAIVYQGSTIPLGYMATDAAGQPCDVPSDIEAAVTGGPGFISNGCYTAGWGKAYVDVALSSPSTGASGTTQFMLTDRLDGIATRAEGMIPSGGTVYMDEGTSVRLTSTATYIDKPVIINQTGFVYGMTEGLGRISRDGVITAYEAGSGFVTVSAGGCSNTLKLVVNEAADPSEFSDTKGTWTQPYVTDLYFRGIVKGMEPGIYGIDTPMRRGDFVLMLYRASGSPAVSGNSPFADVAPQKYYADAVSWAASCGLALGYEGGREFGPEDSLTREQAFTLVYRYLMMDPELSGGKLADPDERALDAYHDSWQISDYAEKATAALVENSIIGGINGWLIPKETLTRGQMARILSSSFTFMEK